MNTRIVGRQGETIAAEYLRKHRYRIIDKNFNCRFGEIDLIAWNGETVVFVEVKARSNTKFGMPREAVDWHKQQTIIRCANYWLYKNKQTGIPVRFDVVELINGQINHIIDAFRP